MKKILNHLATDWYKYLLELIVITAGVLGAFVLNNWNEATKDRKKEVLLLKEINQEFTANFEQFRAVTEAHQQALTATNYFLNDFLTNPTQDSISQYLPLSGRHFTFNPSQSTLASLLTNSSIDIISNDTLRRELIQWNDRVIDYQEEELKARRFVENIMYPWAIEHANMNTGEINNLSEEEMVRFQNIILLRQGYLQEIVTSDDLGGQTLLESMKIIIKLSASN